MDENGGDRISDLPESVICQILSHLPTKDAVQTSVLSKEWEHKWTSIYNIQIDDGFEYIHRKSKNFIRFVDRTLRLTQGLRLKSFRLSCDNDLCNYPLKRWTSAVLMRGGVQTFEINSKYQRDFTFPDGLYNCSSLTKLRLSLDCTLDTSLMTNCFPNLKILCLCDGVQLSNYEIPNTGKVTLNFPVLEELELRCCIWLNVKSVEINAPALFRLLVQGQIDCSSEDYLIKIHGAKLAKFEASYTVENIILTAPSVFNAVLTSHTGDDTIGFRAHAILDGFPALEYLKLSSVIVEALVESKEYFPFPICFFGLKQLEIDGNITHEALLKLLQVISLPSLESLFLDVYDRGINPDYEGLESLPLGIASHLKVVRLDGFEGTKDQIRLAKFVLKNAENLEKLFVTICYHSCLPKNHDIMRQLSKFPITSTRASIVVNGLPLFSQFSSTFIEYKLF